MKTIDLSKRWGERAVCGISSFPNELKAQPCQLARMELVYPNDRLFWNLKRAIVLNIKSRSRPTFILE